MITQNQGISSYTPPPLILHLKKHSLHLVVIMTNLDFTSDNKTQIVFILAIGANDS